MFFDAWCLTKFPSTRRLFLSLKFFLPESNVKNLFPNSNSSREKEIRSNRILCFDTSSRLPLLLLLSLARSNAKKWNEINADNCRQQLAGVPACRPTSLTGLRVARVSRRIVSTAIHFVPSYNPGRIVLEVGQAARRVTSLARVSRMMTNRNEQDACCVILSHDSSKAVSLFSVFPILLLRIEHVTSV